MLLPLNWLVANKRKRFLIAYGKISYGGHKSSDYEKLAENARKYLLQIEKEDDAGALLTDYIEPLLNIVTANATDLTNRVKPIIDALIIKLAGEKINIIYFGSEYANPCLRFFYNEYRNTLDFTFISCKARIHH